MKKLAAILIGFTILGGSSLIGRAQGTKIGFVNTLEVLNGTEEGKRQIQQLNEFISQKQQQIASQSSELQRLQQQYSTQQRTLNPETRAEMERTIRDKERELQRLQEDVQLELEERRNQVLGAISEKLRKIINEYAPQNGFGVIFLRDPTQQTYIDPALDLTQEIIRIYNERNPIAGQQSSPTNPSPNQPSDQPQ